MAARPKGLAAELGGLEELAVQARTAPSQWACQCSPLYAAIMISMPRLSSCWSRSIIWFMT